ncbi:MAG: threonine--tRNA ligase [Defluviitaleaceae bacterium]|nr:threonine--tRNA ligase [Defluviitaleaceae bacterium]
MAKNIANDANYIEAARHSLSHVLAQAVCELFDGVQLGIGPAIEDGLYYDFDLHHRITEDDFAAIEAKMNEILKSDTVFEKRVVENPLDFFANTPYKLELVKELVAAGEEITVYESNGFVDLCAGPHVENMRELRNWGFKISSIAGAYWRGNSDNPMLQRVYVHAFPSRKELKEYYAFLEEAKKRDHRTLGNQLDLFFFDETAPGMPYWMPKGMKIYNKLLEFSRKVHEAHGYQEVVGPQLNHSSLWVTSGHWEHYDDNMFKVQIDENNTYALKPMNCPNAMILFKKKNRSYRDLPLRFSELSHLHRNEASGAMHGLMRVQTFRQDDAHIFCTQEQIASEMNGIMDIMDFIYGIFGLKYTAVLSTRPESFLGDIETWNEAEAVLKNVLDTRFGAGEYIVDEGGGAFYGPKIDIKVYDALKREWQLCTIQLDYQLAGNFELEYTDSDGKRKAPVVIHRAVFGSLDRFIGVITEHFAARFPFWLAPVQVGIVPVHKDHERYAHDIREELVQQGFKSTLDTSDGTMGNKIKSYRNELVPYIIIIGDKEVADGTISLRVRTGTQINGIPLSSFIDACKIMEQAYKIDLIENFDAD